MQQKHIMLITVRITMATRKPTNVPENTDVEDNELLNNKNNDINKKDKALKYDMSMWYFIPSNVYGFYETCTVCYHVIQESSVIV